MDSGPVWPHPAAAPNAVQPPTAQQRIADARTVVLTIAATVPHELRKRRRAVPNSVPAATATKAQPGPLVRSVALAMMLTDQLTALPAGNPSEEMTLGEIHRVGMSHIVSPLDGAVTKRSKPRAQTAAVAMTDRPATTVVLAMTAPLVATLPNTDATRPTPSPHGQLRHAPTAVNGMTVPHVAIRLIAVATVMRTHLDQLVPIRSARNKGAATIGLRAEIVMIAPRAETAMTGQPTGTMPRVLIVDRERPRVVPSRASLPHPAAIGRRRTPRMTSPTRLAPSLRRSMPRRGNMPSRC